MSEFQYYEWQAVDRPLTAQEMAEVEALSSHIEVTASNANVTYNWGDFKHDSIEVLRDYFDALLYFANWGSRQVAFRFPHGLVTPDLVQPYLDEDRVSFTTGTDYDILEMNWSDMESGEYEPDFSLGPLVEMRHEILQGDVRSLYIAWLQTQLMYGATDDDDDEETTDNDDDDDDEEAMDNDDDGEEATDEYPPVPPGLRTLTAAQRALIDLLELDPFLVEAAAESSAPLTTPEDDFAAWVRLLSADEQADFLCRLAQGEPGVQMRLVMRLRDLGQGQGSATGQGTVSPPVGVLARRADTLRKEFDRAEAKRLERERVARLKALFGEEERMWNEATALLESGHSASSYDACTNLLVTLRDVAKLRGQTADFTDRLGPFVERFAKREALMKRLRAKHVIT